MPDPGHLSTRLGLPLDDYIGGREVGTVKSIRAGVFKDLDDNFPSIVATMLVSVNNIGLFINGDAVTL